jgi:hypothetical protein
VFVQEGRPGAADEPAQHQSGDERVVELADHGQEARRHRENARRMSSWIEPMPG